MPKRYTSTEKWNDPWFRKLPAEIKAFWDYLTCHCDNAGVWEIDLEDASFRVGYSILTSSLLVINDGKERIKISRCGKYFLVKDFIAFHIGDLYQSKLTNLQKSCIVALYKHVTMGRFDKEDFGFTGKLPVDYRYKDKKIEGQEDKIINKYDVIKDNLKLIRVKHPKSCTECWGNGVIYPQGGGVGKACPQKFD